jgi:Ca-activated chloride channel family protein
LTLARRLLAQAGAAGGEVILLTDGTGVSPAARQAAARLAADGHRLSVLALTPADADTESGPVPRALFALARVGGGVAVPARPDDSDLDRLLPALSARSAERSSDPVAGAEGWRDDGPWLLLLLLPVAALAFRRGWLGVLPLAVCLLPPAPVSALDWGRLWDDLWLREDQQALRALLTGGPAARIEDPRWRAAAHYRAGDWTAALTALTGQPGAEAHYNRGTVLARLGRLTEAVAEYDAALLLEPDHRDARHNRALLRARLRPPPAAAGAGTSDPPPAPEPDPEADPTPVPSTADAAASTLPPKPKEARMEDDNTERRTDETAAVPVADDDVRQPVDPELGARPEAGTTTTPHPEQAIRDKLGVADVLLRQVPDDPSGLLRERLLLQYLRRHGRLY